MVNRSLQNAEVTFQGQFKGLSTVQKRTAIPTLYNPFLYIM